jgi:hypothetical protein
VSTTTESNSNSATGPSSSTLGFVIGGIVTALFVLLSIGGLAWYVQRSKNQESEFLKDSDLSESFYEKSLPHVPPNVEMTLPGHEWMPPHPVSQDGLVPAAVPYFSPSENIREPQTELPLPQDPFAASHHPGFVKME